MNTKIIQNPHGFHQVADPASEQELCAYYAEKYFQQEHAYQSRYDDAELKHLNDKLRLKEVLIRPFIAAGAERTLLDVGCGEGFTLPFFANRGWRVLGTDHSDFALRRHHPEHTDNFEVGGFMEVLSRLEHRGCKFTVIWLDNVLEHVRDPLALLKSCSRVASAEGLLFVDVPNDFSRLQRAAVDAGLAPDQFWVALPDHLSYFNANGLRSLAEEAGWTHCRTVSDFPIDFNIFNPQANYVLDRTKGKDAHTQRQTLEHLFLSISLEKTLDLYEALANLGLGRSIQSVFKLPESP
jgi:SAM-dependent methyltransferase